MKESNDKAKKNPLNLDSDMTEPSFTKLTDLAAKRLGGKALLCSDDFFCPERKSAEAWPWDLYS